MAEQEPTMGQLGWGAYCKFRVLNHHYFPLTQWERGSDVEIEWLGQVVDGAKLAPDSNLKGVLVDSRNSVIKLAETDCPDLQDMVGRRIGLSCRIRTNTPAGIAVDVTMRSCVMKNAVAGFYLPDEVSPDSRFGCPSEDQYRWPMTTYGRLCVDDTILFDQADNTFTFDYGD